MTALKEQHDRIEAKAGKLSKFEDFLKLTQAKYSDEFTELNEIKQRYEILFK